MKISMTYDAFIFRIYCNEGVSSYENLFFFFSLEILYQKDFLYYKK